MKKTFIVSMEVEVEIDETKFTPEFLAEFKRYIFDVNRVYNTGDDMEAHMKYFAELYASGRVKNGEVVEGYGDLKKMGVKLDSYGIEVDPCS